MHTDNVEKTFDSPYIYINPDCDASVFRCGRGGVFSARVDEALVELRCVTDLTQQKQLFESVDRLLLNLP